jgi:hypothetical protein
LFWIVNIFLPPSKTFELFEVKDEYDVPEITSWADTKEICLPGEGLRCNGRVGDNL